MNPSQRRVLRAFLAVQLDSIRPRGHRDNLEQLTCDVEAFIADTSDSARLLVSILLEVIHILSFGSFSKWTIRHRRDWLERFAGLPFLSGQIYDLVATLANLGWLVIYARPEGRRLAWPHENPKEPGTPIPGPHQTTPDLGRRYSVCVIGSGAGGSVVAARLAKQGRDVLMIEAGPWLRPNEFSRRDDLALRQSYKFAGVQPALASPFPVGEFLRLGHVGVISVLQGHLVGGGPAVNNAICFRIPSPASGRPGPWNEWLGAGVPFGYSELEARYKIVEHDLQFTPTTVDDVSGWRSALFAPPRPGWLNLSVAVHECIGCGGCNTGCRYGFKTGGLHGPRGYGRPQSYLMRALTAGAQIAAGLRAERFEIDNGRVRRVVLCDAAHGSTIRIEADTFVLAAGPIASTSVLGASGLGRSLPIGQRFSGNVVTPVFGVVPDPPSGKFDPGLQICYFVGEAGELLRETWFHYPGSVAASLPGWFDEHAAPMLEYERLAGMGVVVPTGPHGHIDRSGRPFLTLDQVEFSRMRRGLVEASNDLFDVGAERVYLASKRPTCFGRHQQPELSRLIARSIESPADLNLATAHPQGGNALSKKREISVVDSSFQVRGAAGLFVADASLFPAACGVNPMLTTMALAHMVADEVLASR